MAKFVLKSESALTFPATVLEQLFNEGCSFIEKCDYPDHEIFFLFNEEDSETARQDPILLALVEKTIAAGLCDLVFGQQLLVVNVPEEVEVYLWTDPEFGGAEVLHEVHRTWGFSEDSLK